jgi:hypothetical protein
MAATNGKSIVTTEPYARTVAVLCELDDLFTQLISLEAINDPDLYERIHRKLAHGIQYLRDNFDIPTVVSIVEQEKLPNTKELVELLTND